MSEEPPPDAPDDATPPPGPAAPPPPPREPLSNWIKVIAGVLGIALTATTLYFLLFPRDEGCEAARSGTLGEPTVDQGVSYRDFLRITNQQDEGADEVTLRRPGTLIDVPITAVGYLEKPLPLRWTTLTSAGAGLPDGELTDQLALEFVPEDCSDQGRRKLWAPWPTQAGRYLIEVTLLDEDGELLDTRRTAAFAISGR